MGGPRGSQQASVRLQIEIEFDRVYDVAVDDGAGSAVPATIGFALVHGEEADVMPLADDNDSYARSDFLPLTGPWG